MAELNGKHGLSEKEYTDDVVPTGTGRGQAATDQYVHFATSLPTPLMNDKIWKCSIPVRCKGGEQAQTED